MTEGDDSWKDIKAKHVMTTYNKIRNIMKEDNVVDMLDQTMLMSILMVDYIEMMGRIDDIDTFMDQYKFLVMKQARTKRGYN